MNRQQGATLVEVLGALVIAIALSISIAGIADSTLSENKGQQAAMYQAQVAAAANRYIQANYATLLAQATTTTPAPPVSLAMLKPQYLSASFSSTNPYGQSPCLLVLKNAAGQLDGLLVNEGGTPIPAKEIAYVASRSGQGAGFIPTVISGTPPPLQVKSPYGSWGMSNATLMPYLSAKCSATTAGAGSLVNELFFDGPARRASDFVARDALAGRTELNRMNTPLHIVDQAVVAVENSSDQYCTAADANTYGGISTNAAGEVLSCQAGTWRRQNKYWREPVASVASLPATGNTTGDVRMVTGSINRAFAWNGSAWAPLSIDQNGDMVVPNLLKIDGTVTYGASCQKGQTGKDASGRLMSCESTTWEYVSRPELLYRDVKDKDDWYGLVIMKSDYISYPAGTAFYTGSIGYDSGSNMHYATIDKSFTLSREGVANVQFSAYMDRRISTSAYDYSVLGRACVTAQIWDKDTGWNLYSDGQCTSVLNNDWAGPNITISQYLPKNINGYGVTMKVYWTLMGTGPANDIYNQSNDVVGATYKEMTPLSVWWQVDVTSR